MHEYTEQQTLVYNLNNFKKCTMYTVKEVQVIIHMFNAGLSK